MGMEKFDMYAQLYEAQKRFNLACDQITLLNLKLDAMNQRYQKAKDECNRHFRYTLRMRIMVLAEMMVSYCNYACMKKNEVLDLRFKLYGENPDDGEAVYSGMDNEILISED